MKNIRFNGSQGVCLAVIFSLAATGCQSTANEDGKTGAGLGAVVGGLVANLAAKDSKNRGLWTVLGAVIGAGIGKNIEKHLNKKEQAQMQQATISALNSEEKASWSSDSSNIKGSAYVTKTDQRNRKTEIPVLKARIKEVPPLDMVAGTFTAKTSSNLRGGPSTDYVKVGSLTQGQVVTVVGKVVDQDWYLISQGGVGSGFIHTSLVDHTPEKKESPENSISQDQSAISSVAVQANTLCREVVQEVVLETGKTVQDTVRACKGPNGWEIMA